VFLGDNGAVTLKVMARFKTSEDERYKWFLGALHRAHVSDWHLEICCRTGDTFSPSRSRTIAVDPFFRVEQNVIGPKPALHIFQMPSDDFFATGFLARNETRLGLSFIDGMHLIQNVLLDLIHVERHSAPVGGS
jgi:hypothetical protein